MFIKILFLLILSISALVESSAWADEAAIDRFMSEYPEAARRLEGLYNRSKGSCRIREISGTEQLNSRPGDEAEFAIDHGYTKLKILHRIPESRDDPSVVEVVYCSGEDEYFELVRLPGSTIYVVEKRGDDQRARSAFAARFGRFFDAPLGPAFNSVSSTMERPGFRLKDARALEVDGRKLIQVDYEVGELEPREQFTVLLDPQAGWAVRSTEYRPSKFPQLRFTSEVTYTQSTDGKTVPKMVTFREPRGTATCEFVDWNFESTPIDEFSMSFYDLPDIASDARKPKSFLYYWLIGIAVVGIAVALFLRRLGRKN